MLQTPSALRGMVTSPHHLASQAGLDVLRAGGTAVEAAVATAACLAVVYPHMTGIGGDSFWLIAQPDGRIDAIDACGRAAQAANLAIYAGHKTIPWRGPLAANTVAGAVSGWQAALATGGGTLSLDRLLGEAIHLAEAGVAVTAGGAEIAHDKAAELGAQFGYAEVFMPAGAPLSRGAILKQPALARTLRRLATDGLQSFYDGGLAQDIATDLVAAGSPVSSADLSIHRAESVRPLSARIKGARLFNMPPPTQGVASLLILALFDRLGAAEADGFDHVHGLVEATKQAFLFRDAHVGDPAFMGVDCQARLDDAEALDAMAARIDPARAMPWPQPPAAGDTV